MIVRAMDRPTPCLLFRCHECIEHALQQFTGIPAPVSAIETSTSDSATKAVSIVTSALPAQWLASHPLHYRYIQQDLVQWTRSALTV